MEDLRISVEFHNLRRGKHTHVKESCCNEASIAKGFRRLIGLCYPLHCLRDSSMAVTVHSVQNPQSEERLASVKYAKCIHFLVSYSIDIDCVTFILPPIRQLKTQLSLHLWGEKKAIQKGSMASC